MTCIIQLVKQFPSWITRTPGLAESKDFGILCAIRVCDLHY